MNVMMVTNETKLVRLDKLGACRLIERRRLVRSLDVQWFSRLRRHQTGDAHARTTREASGAC